MPLRLVTWLSLLAACGADSAGFGLRGAVQLLGSPKASSEPLVERKAQHVSCACATAAQCHCSRSALAQSLSEEERLLEQAVLNRTKHLSAWWEAQNETERLTPWTGPLLAETTEMTQRHDHWYGGPGGYGWGGPGWVGPGVGGCGGGGGCGCVALVGCGCTGNGCPGGIGWR